MGYGGGWGEDPNNPGDAPVNTSADSYNPYGDPNNAGVTPVGNMSDYIDQHGLYAESETGSPIYLGAGGDTLAYLESIKPEGFQGNWYNYLVDHGYINNESGGLGGIAGYIRTHGYMVPLAAMAAFGGAAAAGAGAAEAGGAAAAGGAGGAAAGGAGAAGAGAAGAGTAAGTAAGTSALEAYMASAGLAPGTFGGAAFTMPGAVAGAAQLAGPTYGELGYTGLGEGMAGPTYAELGYTGLNNAEAIAAADAAAKGMSYSEIIKSIDNARKIASAGNTLSKLLAGGTGGTGGTAGRTSSVNPMQLGNLLAGGTPQTSDFLGQYKMNEKPFFGSNEGTLGGENVYDVSGAKLANALRNK